MAGLLTPKSPRRSGSSLMSSMSSCSEPYSSTIFSATPSRTTDTRESVRRPSGRHDGVLVQVVIAQNCRHVLRVGQVLRRHASELCTNLLGVCLGGIARVVADHQVVFGIHAGTGELLELHLHELALVAQLDDAILKLGLCLLHDLEARENTGNVGERNVVVELEGRQAQQGAVERLTSSLKRGDELVDRAHDGGDGLDLVALAVNVHVNDGTTAETEITMASVSTDMRAAVR